MEVFDLVKVLLIFDFYHNLYSNKKSSLRNNIYSNRFKILNEFDLICDYESNIISKEEKPIVLMYKNEKLFDKLLEIIYKRIDLIDNHDVLKFNLLATCKYESSENIYNLAYNWCTSKYY